MGKKRQVVQVDEEKLKMMMAGDIPIKADLDKDVVISHINTKKENVIPIDNEYVREEKTVVYKETAEAENVGSDYSDSKKYSKRRKSKSSYIEQFLSKPGPASRRPSTIHLDDSNYRDICLVTKITDNLSIANFINNVLSHHFEQYRNEIDETVKDYFNDLYKK